jgi:phospholipid/cholesterol/gamma-HCH transport system permease protein
MSSAPYPASPGGGRAPRVLASFADRVADWGEVVINGVTTLGELAVFSWGTVVWLFTRGVRRETLMPNFYQVTVLSLPVIALTGTFIGMVLAVQSAIEFRQLGLQTRLGAVITLALVRELGPVLAATMLAGRVGSRMAAELGTMRVTEQIDALSCMGTNPIHYLVVPRFVACLFGIPLLTIIADFMGIVGAYMYCIFVEHIDKHHYWFNAIQFVNNWDLFVGVAKSLFFGAAIAMVSCHRGFNCGAGAEGVGRAATASFVLSFVMILLLDLFLNIFLDKIYFSLWPGTARGL